MNENEIMVNEEITENPEVENETVENSGFGLGVLIGGLLTVGGIAAVKGIKKIGAKIKAKKQSSNKDEVEVEDYEVQENPEVKK